MQKTTHLIRGLALIAATVAASFPALSADLRVKFEKAEPGEMLPPENAACVAAHNGKSRPGKNESPAIMWSKGPAGTRSYALTLVDPMVPVDRTVFDKDGVSIAADAPRGDFVHWVLADIPGTETHIPLGADGDGIVKEGLPLKTTLHGRRGQNGSGDGTVKTGPHGGYLGACPPWNDERIHQYHLTVYALDVAKLPLPQVFTRADLIAAVKGHTLATGTAALDFTTNPRARK